MQYPHRSDVFTHIATTPATSPMPPAEAEGQVREAFRTIGPRLRSWLRQQLPQRGDVEDLLQDVFCEFVLAQRALEPIGDATAWLFRVARNRLIDWARRRQTQARMMVEYDDEGADALEELLSDPRGGPEAHYARRVLIAELERALEALPAAGMAHRCGRKGEAAYESATASTRSTMTPD